MENGFKAMSQAADVGSGGKDNEDRGGSTAKRYDVDTDQFTDAAIEQVSELQQLLLDEIRARPMRALGWAVAAGVVLGFWAAK
ncbi:hypothetical protein ASE63_24930 [Bosea sp. Root381]|uniref:hypothetical protein n=1 Tax=Bosea sp. Root381 TaxID=1736524 RepID=UPI0006F8F95C|nr:hypothetical protein [Bosea sp. Root381]KRE05014.1 hypothetical protein ASE63_24930 [Bosea sp. Root381]